MKDEPGGWIEIDDLAVAVTVLNEPASLDQAVVGRDVTWAGRPAGSPIGSVRKDLQRGRASRPVNVLADGVVDPLPRGDFASQAKGVIGEMGQQASKNARADPEKIRKIPAGTEPKRYSIVVSGIFPEIR